MLPRKLQLVTVDACGLYLGRTWNKLRRANGFTRNTELCADDYCQNAVMLPTADGPAGITPEPNPKYEPDEKGHILAACQAPESERIQAYVG